MCATSLQSQIIVIKNGPRAPTFGRVYALWELSAKCTKRVPIEHQRTLCKTDADLQIAGVLTLVNIVSSYFAFLAWIVYENIMYIRLQLLCPAFKENPCYRTIEVLGFGCVCVCLCVRV